MVMNLYWPHDIKKDRVVALGTHLSSSEFFGILIELIDMGGEGLEVWDDKLLPEGLGEQDNVALDTPDGQIANESIE